MDVLYIESFYDGVAGTYMCMAGTVVTKCLVRVQHTTLCPSDIVASLVARHQSRRK